MALPQITHPLIRSDKAAAELAGDMGGGQMSKAVQAACVCSPLEHPAMFTDHPTAFICIKTQSRPGHSRAQELCIPGNSWEILKEKVVVECTGCGDIGWPSTGKTAHALKSTASSVRSALSRVSFEVQLQVLLKGLRQPFQSHC